MSLSPKSVLEKLKVPQGLIHMRGRSYVDHLLSVHAGLLAWMLPIQVRLAGLVHSIYGTERFHFWKLSLDQRSVVREVVGTEAELLAYANCAIVREDFDEYAKRGHRKFASRFGGEINFADGPEFVFFCAIHLADWLDQVEITQEWKYRYDTYRWIADFLGHAPLATFRWVYRNRGNIIEC